MSLDLRYPALSDLKARARARMPHFVWEYLVSATGTEAVVPRNRAGLDRVLFSPAILEGLVAPELSQTLLGRRVSVPFGVAPVGMSGLMWPGAEAILARFCAQNALPYGLSTVAAAAPEDVGHLAGDMGWFQLYTPKDPDMRRDILRRARAAGFHTLIFTADVPGPSRRERQLRAQLTIPPRVTPGMLAQVALRPAWALGMARHGMPRLKLMESYKRPSGPTGSTGHVGYQLRAAPDWAYLAETRAEWDGPVVVKGVLRPEDAARCKAEGVDAVWVSNHGGRQFEGAPASIDALPSVRAAVGPDYPVIFDGGVESGLDILRACALGADFVMLGRGWHHALGALGPAGPAHLLHILTEDLKANMVQMAISRVDQAHTRLAPAVTRA